MCNFDTYKHRLFRYLRHPGPSGVHRRRISRYVVVLTILLLWLLIVGGLNTGFVLLAYSGRVDIDNTTTIVTPLLNMTKRCLSAVDDCDADPANCFCIRAVDCNLYFANNVTAVDHQTLRYSRCYPEACDPSEFCKFVIGHNYTLWRSNAMWSVTPTSSRYAAYIAGMLIGAIVIAIHNVFITMMSVMMCNLANIWIPLPRRI
jgi:hypothetical protein